MKKLLISLVCLSLLLSVGFLLVQPSQAARGDRERPEFGYVNAKASRDDVAAVERPCHVYALTLYAHTASAYVCLFDRTSSPSALGGTASTAAVRAEIGEATQYESIRVVYDPPLIMNNGVYMDVQDCWAIVEYR